MHQPLPAPRAPVRDRTGGTHPHRSVAAAVIRQAIADTLSRTVPDPVRITARRFLDDSPGFRAWCVVANLDPKVVKRRLPRAS